MKIAIEAQRIFRPNKHGMDFVALEAIRCLQQIDTHNEYFIFVSPSSDRCLKESENVHIIEVNTPSYPLWEQVGLPRAVRRIQPDLLHCTSNTAPICGKTPLVLTLHDIIFLEKQSSSNKSTYQKMGRLYRRLVVPRILDQCTKIITVSEFERQRILSTLNLDPQRLIAIHNGYNPRFHPLKAYESTTKKYLPEAHYLFFLGNTDPKKNTLGTLKAYANYVQRSNTPLPLLIADLQEEVVDTLLKEHDLTAIKPLLRFSGYIPNSDLPALYNGASAFLYTSLRESFGIPLLEAMACGTPVISSNTSAIPEIAGEGALLVDPLCAEAIANALLRLEQDSSFRTAQVTYGLERVKRFSWEQTARHLLTLYESIGQR
ncbi:MAG: glycosyltransferase family 1 protein [Alistipes sp.]